MRVRGQVERNAPRSLRVRALVAVVFTALVACRGPEVAPAGAEVTSPPPLDPALGSRPRPEPEPAPREPISEDPVIQALVELAAVDSQVDDFVEALAVDIGPRLTGSTQLVEAELWAVDQLEAWGLAVAREPWGEYPVAFERGKATGAIIRPEREQLEFGTWAWTPGTRGQDGLEAGGAVRGQALRYPETAAELRERKPYLRGAWIMIPHDFHGPRGKLRQQIEGALERAPIAGLVYAAGGPDDLRIVIHGEHRLDPAKLPTRVELHLRGDQHAELLARMDAGVYVELEFGVANRLLPGPVPAHNVIAELLGGELPAQRVVVGGHLDSWDGASGAVDNATGVATTMEAARLIATACARAGVRPRRTLSFQLWSGEEQGLLGAKAWVAAHEDQLAGISAVLVHDNGTNYISALPVTPEQYAAMEWVFAPVEKLAPEAMPFRLDLAEGLPFESSDSSAFLAAGVPAFFWAQSGRSDYDRYHHTQFDHADAVIDEYQRHSALVVAIAAWQLAQLPELLDRHNLVAPPRRTIGVSLDGITVEGVARGSLAAGAGIRVGDRIVEIDGIAVEDSSALVAATQRGGSRKVLVIRREGDEKSDEKDDSRERIQLTLDWSDDPDEAQREARRVERRERFEPQLRPWDVGAEDSAGASEGDVTGDD